MYQHFWWLTAAHQSLGLPTWSYLTSSDPAQCQTYTLQMNITWPLTSAATRKAWVKSFKILKLNGTNLKSIRGFNQLHSQHIMFFLMFLNYIYLWTVYIYDWGQNNMLTKKYYLQPIWAACSPTSRGCQARCSKTSMTHDTTDLWFNRIIGGEGVR
jgi:hypothetical protein